MNKLKYKSIRKLALEKFHKQIINLFSYKIKEIKIFGSTATGKDSFDSDIDVFILVDEKDEKLREKIIEISSDICIKYGVLISPKIFTANHWNYIKKLNTLLYRNIEKEGIRL